MEKIKSVIGRKSTDGTHEAETSPSSNTTSGGLSGQGSHLGGAQQSASTGATGSEGYHPIYDQFKGQHDTSALSGDANANLASATQTQHNTAPRSGNTLTSDASTASIRSGVIGFPEGDHDSHASLGHNPIKRELGTTQVQAPGAGSLPDHTLGDERQGESHIGRDAALGAGAVGAGGAAVHELHHQKGDVSSVSPIQSHTRTVEQNERRTEPETTAAAGHSHTSHHKDHKEHKEHSQPKTEQVPQHQSTYIGEQKDPANLGRDAAIGAGAVGAGGLAAHEYGRRHDDDTARGTTGQSSTVQGYSGQPTQQTPQHQSTPIGSQQESSHLGRDAALGAGALGAGGVAAHEHNRRHEDDVSRGTANPLSSQGLTGHSTQQTPQHQTTYIGEQKHSSHLGRDAVIGAGALGAGGLAAHELSGRREDRSRDLSNTEGTTGTDRSFPLAGGVTGGHSSEPVASSTHDREPGTKEREAGVLEGQSHGREGLATAAAAAAATSANPSSHHERERESIATREQEHTSVGNTSGTAASAFPLSSEPGHEHDHAGHGHTYTGDPCEEGVEPAPSGTVFAGGPHSTDTANRLDPHLHVPGEWQSPTPTPAKDNSEPFFGSAAGARSAPTATTESEKLTSEHHYGRDAAIAGGVGAAGIGALAGAKHHQKEETDIGGEQFPTETSPYSSKTVDPRVYGKSQPPSSTTAQSVPASQIPVAPKSTHGREAAMAAGYEASKQHGGLTSQENTQPSTTQSETTPSTTQPHDEHSEHHYGRDVGLAGAGAAAAGGLHASQRHDKADSTGPASGTIGPHSSNAANIVDPKVQPDPALQKHQVGATSTSEDPASKTIGPHKSNIANILDPRVQPQPEKQATEIRKEHGTLAEEKEKDQHHYGRDAALTGGVGAAGLGAYEAGKSYDTHKSTQPSASMNEQRYDPTAPGAHQPTLGKEESHVHYPTPGSPEEPYRGGSQHHGKGPAAAGVGAGAAGAGAYAASKDAPKSDFAKQLSHDEVTTGAQDKQHHYGRDAAVAGGLGAAGAGAYAATRGNDSHQPQSTELAQETQQPTTAAHQRYDSTQVQNPDQKEDHTKRNAALGAGALGASGAAAYGLSQHDNDKAEKERLAARQKELDHQQKEQAKEIEKQQKHQQKELEKEHKEEKHHDKLVAAELKKHDKEADKAEKKHEKELAKEEKKEEKVEEKGEKKHHLFGFLHRDKKDKQASDTESSPRQSKEYAPSSAAAIGAGGVAAASAADSGAGPTLEHRGSGEHNDGRNRLHKDPPPGHPAREAIEAGAIGGTGKHEHIGTDGAIGRADQISGDHTTKVGTYGAHEPDSQHHTVTEPYTGLPMNVEKYGDGHGGTDGSSTVGGYHNVPKEQRTDWDAIKKANTPY